MHVEWSTCSGGATKASNDAQSNNPEAVLKSVQSFRMISLLLPPSLSLYNRTFRAECLMEIHEWWGASGEPERQVLVFVGSMFAGMLMLLQVKL